VCTHTTYNCNNSGKKNPQIGKRSNAKDHQGNFLRPIAFIEAFINVAKDNHVIGEKKLELKSDWQHKTFQFQS